MKPSRAPWAALAFAAACQVDDAAEVALYREPLEAGLCAQPEIGAVFDVRHAMLLANERNERLSIEGEGYLRALIDRRRVAAAWLPRVDLSPGYFLRDAQGGSVDGVDVPLDARIDVNPRGQLNEQARVEFEARRRLAQLYATQDALLIDVARTHFTVLQAERSAGVLEGSLGLQQARVDDVRARNEVGVARPLDVALSESSLVDAQVALITTERITRNGRALLSFLTGADASAAPLEAAIDLADDPRTTEELLEVALAGRPEVAAAARDVEAAARNIEVARSQWWPRASLDLTAFLSRDSAPTTQEWSFLFEVSLPLFEGGRIRADIRDAFSFLREAKLQLSLVQRSVRRDVEVAHANLEVGSERVAALRRQLAAADEAFDQAEALYDAGLATNLERVTAQDQRLRTALQLETAELEQRIFKLDLLRATGQLHAWLGLTRPWNPEGLDAEAR